MKHEHPFVFRTDIYSMSLNSTGISEGLCLTVGFAQETAKRILFAVNDPSLLDCIQDKSCTTPLPPPPLIGDSLCVRK